VKISLEMDCASKAQRIDYISDQNSTHRSHRDELSVRDLELRCSLLSFANGLLLNWNSIDIYICTEQQTRLSSHSKFQE
jgi:hypothetical protein